MRFFLVLLLSMALVYGASSIPSPIPLPQNIFIDIDAKECDNECAQILLHEEKIFSFLSRYKKATGHDEIERLLEKNQYIFRTGPQSERTMDTLATIKIAVLVPQKVIKKYSVTTVNSIISFLLHKNNYFDLKVFNSDDEKESSIITTVENIKAENYLYVIAPLTQEGARILVNNSSGLTIYIPTLHKSSINNSEENIFFGGIDYEQQIAKLAEFANDKIAIFNDGTQLGEQLNDMVKTYSPRVVYNKKIDNSKVNFKQLFKGNGTLNNASIYLNTPLVKTSLIASQLRANEVKPHMLLSTQINYNPMLLTLTQYEDRNNMLIANSIQKTSTELEEANGLFGQDIVYDWVNYSTSIGMDYFYSTFFETGSSRLFKEEIMNNQTQYNISIIKPARYEFTKAEN
ncbi:MAG: hypothetical protein PHW07_04990 [Sulfurospirillaceae bacterium]|nr:hypothetical protein [Sulfurospirillaceae bacterium]